MEKKHTQCDWHYVSGRVNILEQYLLTNHFFEALLSIDDFKDIIINLSNTHLRDYFKQIRHLYEFETILDDYYYTMVHEIRCLSPQRDICDFFQAKKHIFKLKDFIKKTMIAGGNLNSIIQKTFEENAWDNILPEVLKKSFLPFKTSLMRIKKESLAFAIDLIFDSIYLLYVETLSDRMEKGIIKAYLKTYTIAKGLEVIQRAKTLKFDIDLFKYYFLEGFDKSHLFHNFISDTLLASKIVLRETIETSLTPYYLDIWNKPYKDLYPGISSDIYKQIIKLLSSELLKDATFLYKVKLDNYLLELIHPARYIPFGKERVFCYLCNLTTEMHNLKFILGGKVYRIATQMLKERLRRMYG